MTKTQTTYDVALFDGGSDAGSTAIVASSLDEAVAKAAAWAVAGDWDHPGTVQLRLTDGDTVVYDEPIDVGESAEED